MMARYVGKRLKLWFFALCLIAFAIMIVVGWHVILNACLTVLAIGAIVTIVSGRDPWWLQPPLERRGPRN